MVKKASITGRRCVACGNLFAAYLCNKCKWTVKGKCPVCHNDVVHGVTAVSRVAGKGDLTHAKKGEQPSSGRTQANADYAYHGYRHDPY